MESKRVSKMELEVVGRIGGGGEEVEEVGGGGGGRWEVVEVVE